MPSSLELAEAHLMRKIREGVKTIDQTGILASENAVMQFDKPEAARAATAVVEAIRKLVPRA